MKWALLLSGLVELIGGIICYFYPGLLYSAYHISIDLFGLNAMVMGILNILAYKFYVDNSFFKFFSLAMMFMHGALAMVCYRIDPLVFPFQLGGMLTHLAIFIVFLISYLNNVKSDPT